MSADELFGVAILALLIGVVSFPLWRGAQHRKRWSRIAEDRRKHWFK